jgi:hypothetical protein
MKKKLAAIICSMVMGLGFAVAAAPSAQAVTWTYLEYTHDYADIVCSGVHMGTATFGVGWEKSSNGWVRVAQNNGSRHDGIGINNSGNADLYIWGAHQIVNSGGLEWNNVTAAGGRQWLGAYEPNRLIESNTTGWFGVKSTSPWTARAPYDGAPIWSDPRIEVFADVRGVAGLCGSIILQITNPAV